MSSLPAKLAFHVCFILSIILSSPEGTTLLLPRTLTLTTGGRHCAVKATALSPSSCSCTESGLCPRLLLLLLPRSPSLSSASQSCIYRCYRVFKNHLNDSLAAVTDCVRGAREQINRENMVIRTEPSAFRLLQDRLR